MPVPLKPSNLRIPSGPIVPASPLLSLIPRQYQYAAPPRVSIASPSQPLPPAPLTWQWTCHVCKHSYPLGATRRCLRDGHYFCSGTTVSKRLGIRKHHEACTSEFDYRGWKRRADWRRKEIQSLTSHTAKDCWNNCDYPSECCWANTPQDPHQSSRERTATMASILASSPSALAPVAETPTSSPRSDFLTTIRRVTEKRTQNLQALVTNINEMSSPLLNIFLPKLTPVVEQFDEENTTHSQSDPLASPDCDMFDAGIIDSPPSPEEIIAYAMSSSGGDDNPPGGGAIQIHPSPLRSNPPSPPIQPPSPVFAMPEWMDIDIDVESPTSPPRAALGFQALQGFDFGFEKAGALVEGLGISWEGTERRDSGYATWDKEKDGKND